MDWPNSTIEQRKKLYGALKFAADERGNTIAQIYKLIFGVDHSSSYGSTLRAGKFSVTKAQKIYLWLEQRYPGLLKRQFQENDRIDAYLKWENWLERQEFKALNIHLAANTSLSIVKFAPKIVQKSIERGEAFFFSLETAASGIAIGFQKISKDWYLLPLSQSKDNKHTKISGGKHYLPRNLDNNELLPLSEEVHIGKIGFAILIVPEVHSDIVQIQNLDETIKIPTEVLNALFQRLDAVPTVTVFRSAIIVK